MHRDLADTPAQARARPPQPAALRLHGGWLVVARTVWLTVFVLALGVFLARIPWNFADLHSLCTATACRSSGRLTVAQLQALHHLGVSLDAWAIFELGLALMFEVGYVAIGLLIFWRRSDDRMALITSLALVTFGNAFSPEPATPLPPVLLGLSLGMAFVGSTASGLFFYLFPTGRFVPRWVGVLVVIWIAFWGRTNLVLGVFVQPPGPATLLFCSLLASLVVVQVYRYRYGSTPLQRQQTKWVVFGLAVGLLGLLGVVTVELTVPLGVLASMAASALLFACLLLIPLAIAMAIFRYRLWDIDLLLNRVLVYGTLTAGIVGLYVLVVAYLGTLFRTGSNLLISLIATGLVAVLFHPVRALLQRRVNRLLYGQRDEPYAVITGLAQRLEATLAPEAVLPVVVETVAQALKVPYAAIRLNQEDTSTIAASVGHTQRELLVLPLVYQRATIGDLLLAPRAPGEAFTPADLRLLQALTRQVSLAAHAVRLTRDLQHTSAHLQAARAHLVTTREEERRRLRRDLHDGLGPTLAGLTLKIGAARKLLGHDPTHVERLLRELNSDIETTVGDIRRLVYNLRPPALDDLGLVGAIRDCVAHATIAQAADPAPGLWVTVDAPEQLPPLPAAVEVAAYHIVQEALTNVVRHAHARTCRIRLALDALLTVEICDDGVGIAAEHRLGVGIRSMRERAVELDGTCTIASRAAGGTRVLARLPLGKE